MSRGASVIMSKDKSKLAGLKQKLAPLEKAERLAAKAASKATQVYTKAIDRAQKIRDKIRSLETPPAGGAGDPA